MFEKQIQTTVVTKTMTISELKITISRYWKLDPNQIVLKSDNQFLTHNQNVIDLLIRGNSLIVVLDKKEAFLKDRNDLKFSFTDEDFPFPKAGTVDSLTEWLTNTKYPTSDYIKDFLLTYRSFISPNDLFEILKKQYTFPQCIITNSGSHDAKITSSVSYQCKIKVIKVLKTWLSKHSSDFFNLNEESRNLLDDLHEFIRNFISKELPSYAIQLTRLYHRMDPAKRPIISLHGAPNPELPISHTKAVTINSYGALEIARQLCIISHKNFSKIEVKELLNVSWTKENKEILSPNVINLIRRSNNISNWVMASILTESNTKKKIKMYEKFIDVGNHCLALNNFNTLMDIFGGLQNTNILKEKKQWLESTSISSRYAHQTDEWCELLITNNKRGLREKLNKNPSPCVPFLGKSFINNNNKKPKTFKEF